jgi:FkbM family methyltransferase
MKKIWHRIQMKKKMFRSKEADFYRLSEWVSIGDWVIDIGANIGYYTVELAQLVGNKGRVFAFEPVLQTFELLAANVSRLNLENVTLFNLAASENIGRAGINIPKFDTGLDNYYRASLTENCSCRQVFCIPINSVKFPVPIKLVKIDVEGHELQTLKGMSGLLKNDRPLLIVEGDSAAVEDYLKIYDYTVERNNYESPNRIFCPI